MEEEIWRAFTGHCTDHEYEVSNLGRFRRHCRNHTYYLKVDKNGATPKVRVYGKYIPAANAVAKAFLPNFTAYGTALPKDLNYQNIAADNLIWVEKRINVYDYCVEQKRLRLLSKIKKVD